MKKSLLFLFLFVCSINLSVANTKIKKIVINGNKKYNSDYYLGLIKIKNNDIYNVDSCNNAVKDMFSCGCLEDIKTNFNSSNGTLTFTVKEKLSIRRLDFVGAKDFLKDDDAKEKIQTKTKEIISSKSLSDDIETIRNFYKAQGYFKVSVEVEIKDLKNGLADVTFKVNDGGKAKINKIYFIGNKSFSDDTLKKEIISRENRFYRFGKTIYYDTAMIDYDVYMLSQFYNTKGYYGVNISTPIGVYNQKTNKFDVIFFIEENEKFIFGKLKIQDTVKKVDKNLLDEVIVNIKSGDAFNSLIVQNIIESLNYIYTEKGYSFINIIPRMSKGDKDNEIDITFTIVEAEKEYIGKIFIKNNTKTNDNVIRERLIINEGSVYNDFSLRKSIQSIESTGFFDKVTYEETDGYFDNQKDITIKVDEGATGSVGASIGMSSLDGLTLNLNYSQRNFMGTGSALGGDFGVFGNVIETKKLSWRFSANYAKPNLFGTKIYGGTGFLLQNNNSSNRSLINIGFEDFTASTNFFVNYYITDNLSQKIGYEFEYKKLNNVSNSLINIMPKDARYTSEISTSLTYDKINNRYNPVKGYLLSLDLSYAGLFGTVDYIKTSAYASLYVPVYLDKVIFKLEGRAGYITSLNNNPLYPNDGFYLGGHTMRGFDFAGVGPRIKLPDGSYSPNGLSGTKMWYLNSELKFPIYTPKEFGIYGIFFINAGVTTGVEKNSHISNFIKIEDTYKPRSAYGFSLVFHLKALGGFNVSFDFSKTLSKMPYDVEKHFGFNLGAGTSW